MELSRLTFISPAMLLSAALSMPASDSAAIDGDTGVFSAGQANIGVTIASELKVERLGSSLDTTKIRSNDLKFDILKVGSDGQLSEMRLAPKRPSYRTAQVLVLVPR